MTAPVANSRLATQDEQVALGVVEKGQRAGEMLLEIADKMCTLFHDPDRVAYAAIDVSGHREVWPLQSPGFEDWLRRGYFQQRAAGVAKKAYETALATLKAKALYDGTEMVVSVRTASHGGAYFIDLCDSAWRVIRVDTTGWRILDDAPVYFVRHHNMRPLPVPERGGNLADLWAAVNVPVDAQALVLAWMLECFRPETVYPVLEIVAEHGCGKSITQRRLRELIDPNKVALRSLPRKPEDLFLAASNGLMVSLENVSHLSEEMQDILCSLATGGGHATRELYSNGNEFALATKAPIVMNGIAVLATRADLIDRVVHIDLPVITPTQRKQETELSAQWKLRQPKLFGALLDRFVAALRVLSEVELAELPRLADFAKFGEAVVRSGGGRAGEFVAGLDAMRADGVNRTLEGDPVGLTLREFLARTGSQYEGTVGSLLSELWRASTNHEIKLPGSPRGLGDRLRRLAPAFRLLGVEIRLLGHGRDGSKVSITKANWLVDLRQPSPASHGHEGQIDCPVENAANEPAPQAYRAASKG